ncbi:TcaA 3rd/4th domain-containing protein [Bacillus solimangrovi]|uniref:Zinc-ribbon domain-containing protein n=1 Tax=Bacillus solimangrovi TaxID=1305675 RepID=A0A1E5LAA2_9BACI|nr:hypothetical protein [Bacillus solimangrovi]OEH91052.1 hypothetical protein BFG57_06680 [Bacillus solimangrovi]
MKYCHKCGQQLKNEYTYCTECGTKQHELTEIKAQPQLEQHIESKPIKKPRKPLSRKSKVLIGSTFVLVTVLFIMFKMTSNLYDPLQDVKALDAAVMKQDREAFFSIVEVNEDALLDEESYLFYLLENDWDKIRNDLVKAISEDEDLPFGQSITDRSGNKIFVLKKKNESFWGFDQYTIEAVPIRVVVKSNYPMTRFNLDGVAQLVEEADKRTELVRAYPGRYELSAIAENEFGQFKLSKGSVDVVGNGTNKEQFLFSFPERVYTWKADVEGAILFVNGQSTGKTLEDYRTLGPFPNKEVSMHAEWENSDGTVFKSEHVTANDAIWRTLHFKFEQEAIEAQKAVQAMLTEESSS